MKYGESMKNRPLHELLNYDDDDRPVARTQFEMEPANHSMSLSTVPMKHLLSGKGPLVVVLALFLIVAIILTSVELVRMGPPHLRGFQHTDENEAIVSNGFDTNVNQLKDGSTGKRLLLRCAWSDSMICH